MHTDLCDVFGIEYPIFAFSHCRDVVAAVSKAGGLGVLGAVGFTPEQLDIELTWIDEHVDGKPYGGDTVMPAKAADAEGTDPDAVAAYIQKMIPEEHTRFVEELMERFDLPPLPEGERSRGVTGWAEGVAHRHVEIALGHPIALLANALGSPPRDVIDQAHAQDVKIAALAGKAVHAERHVQNGVDIVVAQGYEAGGHTGEIATMVLVPEVVEAVAPTPVLAAGGIATGRQIAAAMALGAEGAWCGSVWLTTEEAETMPAVKEKFLAASSSDTVRSRSLTGKPARMLRSAWTDEWERPDAPQTLPMPLQSALVAEAQLRINRSATKKGSGAHQLTNYFVGQVVGQLDRVRPARQVVLDMVTEYAEVAQSFAEQVAAGQSS